MSTEQPLHQHNMRPASHNTLTADMLNNSDHSQPDHNLSKPAKDNLKGTSPHTAHDMTCVVTT
eukprot:1308118-Amphidinium_carterae.1